MTSGLSISRGSVIVVGRRTFPAAASCEVRKRSGIVYDVVAEQATCARGAVAHLGERFNGIEEVGGSSPPSSTMALPAASAISAASAPAVGLSHRRRPYDRG